MSADAANQGHLPVAVLERTAAGQPTETDPLIPGAHLHKKPFYRARPLWLVPFAITVALARGMTLAPRIEVYTQLACQSVYRHRPALSYIEEVPHSVPPLVSVGTSYPQRYPSISNLSSVLHIGIPPHTFPQDTNGLPRISSNKCITDPAVQAATARLQTLMTTIMGFLSALTTGWWGQFSERYGRTRALAISTFSLFLTELIFVLVSIPSSPLSHHGHKFLIMAPIIEGLMGGPGALHSATSAYVSDCTSPGSRATIFSRFAGVTYLGIAIGPSIGGWLIRHPVFQTMNPAHHTTSTAMPTIMSVFMISIACLFFDFVLAAFILPESLSQEKQSRARNEYNKSKLSSKGKARASDEGPQSTPRPDERRTLSRNRSQAVDAFRRLFGPLAVFLPVATVDIKRLRMRTDWSLTILGIGLFGYYLSQGVYQLKYLYAEHIYGWEAEQLSYYISFLGAARALFLLFVLPSIISIFKPTIQNSKKKSSRMVSAVSQGLIVERVHPNLSPIEQPPINSVRQGKRGAPLTRSQLTREISFDLSLAKTSFFIEMMSDVLIATMPLPTYTTHATEMLKAKKSSKRASEMLFVMASSLSCFGAGVSPAVQSLGLCILQMRKVGDPDIVEPEGGIGSLFGAFGVLQAVGSTILGPMLFGLLYSETVATFPKAVFTLAAAILFIGFLLLMLVKNPGGTPSGSRFKKAKGKRRNRRRVDIERGRSRVSKDLRGGAIPNYSSVR